ncbi:MAG: alpha/beta fold hydrolase [Mycobacterium sp.]
MTAIATTDVTFTVDNHVPERAVRGWGVFAHGFTLGKDSPAAARICKQLAADGIGMLRFDALGLGGSEGDWGDGSFTVKVDDIVKACEFMAARATPADILVGHSWGRCGRACRGAAVAGRAVGCHGGSANRPEPRREALRRSGRLRVGRGQC